MGKKRNQKQTYKPSFFKDQPKEIKRQKTEDSEFKSELKVTKEMFEAARLAKGGVAHIKDLDLSVVKASTRTNAPKKELGNCEILLIDPKTGE